MKQAIIFNLTLSVLIAAMIVWFASCNKDKKEPDPDLSFNNLLGTWYFTEMISPEHSNANFFITFKPDNSYSYVNENETINGIFKIKEKVEQMQYSFVYVNDKNVATTYTYNATLYKMLASGGRDFDQMWLYHFESTNMSRFMAVHFYSGNELVKIFENLKKDAF